MCFNYSLRSSLVLGVRACCVAQAPAAAVLPWFANSKGYEARREAKNFFRFRMHAAPLEDLPEKEYQEKLLKVTLRVQRHWRVVTARKVFADQACV